VQVPSTHYKDLKLDMVIKTM